ncbi:MAG: hypothetical protein K2P78_09385 [Gemmataceae bacterium]|nr:hypothetical protein [Gemmataceae bacterium]
MRLARSGARVPLAAACLLAALAACVERRHALGPLLRHVRRERLARRGPPGGWPDPVTERACVWLARDERVYAALLEQAGNAVLARGHARDSDGAGGETAAQRMAEFLRVSVACWLRSSPDAARFIGSAALTEVDWPRVAEWFLRHRVHPADCRHG